MSTEKQGMIGGDGADDVVTMMAGFQATGRGFGPLWNRISPTIERMVRQRLRKRLLRSPDATDEVVQMVAAKLLELPSKGPKAWFDPTKSGKSPVEALNGWLYGFARNGVRNYCERWHDAREGVKVVAEAALPLNELGEAKSIVKSAVAKIEVDDMELRGIVNECVDDLPEKLRSLIRLSMNEALSERKLAARTGIHVSTIHRRLTKAYDLLRASLAERGIDAAWFAAA